MTVHIIGGGLAGLAAAVTCLTMDLKVRLYEAAPRLGGRCASRFDPSLDAVIDNGTHAVVAGNRHAMRYLSQIGARGRLTKCDLRMTDVQTARSFSPFADLDVGDIAGGLSLLLAQPGTTADHVLGHRRSRARFWEPLCTAVLNTPLKDADARLLGRALARMLFSFAPLLAAESLAKTYIDPADTFIRSRGGEIRCGDVVTSLVRLGARVTAIASREHTHPVAVTDQVILALPPWAPLLEDAGFAPAGLMSSPIVNAHFRVPDRPPHFVGLIGGTGQWLLHRGPIATVTVSAADHLVDLDDSEIATLLWKDIASIVATAPMPAYRVIKERRATVRHSPESERQRRLSERSDGNLVLAGDWTQAALPCTIEAAIASGVAAAKAVRRMS